MKFKYIGDPLDITPEGINGGPLFNTSYGYKWKKHETVIDIPDDKLITDAAGHPANPPMLICKKLLHNRHFELVTETKAQPKKEPEKPRKGPGRPPKRKTVNESSTSQPATAGTAAA